MKQTYIWDLELSEELQINEDKFQFTSPQLTVFNDLCILLESSLDTTISNSKLLAERYMSGQFVQATILPASVLTQGREAFKNSSQSGDAMGKAQLKACANNCLFKASYALKALGQDVIRDSQGRKLSCYVGQELFMKADKARALFNGELDNSPRDYVNTFFRATVWGDAGRLCSDGQFHMRYMIENSKEGACYVSDFDQLSDIEAWREFAMASCQTEQDVILANMLGFIGYISSAEARATARKLGLPVARCPDNPTNKARLVEKYKLDTTAKNFDVVYRRVKFGCSDCKLKCSARRNRKPLWVVSPYTPWH